MNKYVSPYSISESSGILTEKWGVCWYKKLYDWWTMDKEWYDLLYVMHYPRSEQLSPDEFRAIVKFKSRQEFFKVTEGLFTDAERYSNVRITYKHAMVRFMKEKVDELA